MEHGDAEKFLTFYTHISSHAQTSDQKLSRTQAQHFVTYIPDILYGSGNKKPKALPVNSMHHQCLTADFKIDNITSYKGFRMAAWTDRGIRVEKGNHYEVVCEAFRITGWGKSDILAVQWHPEELKDKALLVNFFAKEKKESLLLSMEV
jgi:gamma-glutamyl-gamma-aminobutyrate hydrolase PuuD